MFMKFNALSFIIFVDDFAIDKFSRLMMATQPSTVFYFEIRAVWTTESNTIFDGTQTTAKIVRLWYDFFVINGIPNFCVVTCGIFNTVEYVTIIRLQDSPGYERI